jgi:hypothetical protein
MIEWRCEQGEWRREEGEMKGEDRREFEKHR